MNMTYGYCRISTKKQSIERQERNIKAEYPKAKIFKEEFTGMTLDRPKWKYLNKILKENDTLIFDSVSRMSRNAQEGIELYMELYTRGINLIFLKEPYVNTEVYKQALEQSIPKTGTEVDIILKAVEEYLILTAKKQIEIAFNQSEKELQDIRQRTKEGIETAKRKGKQIGRKTGSKIETKKSKETKQTIINLSKDFKGIYSDAEIMGMLKVSRGTYYKYKKELKENLEQMNEI